MSPIGLTEVTRTEFTEQPIEVIQTEGKVIYSFSIEESRNIDHFTVSSFGEEWKKFSHFSEEEITKIGDDYFDILPAEINNRSRVLDLGCGTGRWASYMSRRAGFVECVDPSDAVYSAAVLLKDMDNIRISRADVDTIPFDDESFDLVYSLGVLHHIPETKSAMASCVKKVKKGGYFLVYLYYNLDNRGAIYKSIFRTSDAVRKKISSLKPGRKKFISDVIAVTVYFPLAKLSAVTGAIGFKKLARKLPLSYYSDKSFWIMKNDALDRFGTPLEQRFSKKQIETMMKDCGLTNIVFSEKEPFWHAVGQKQ